MCKVGHRQVQPDQQSISGRNPLRLHGWRPRQCPPTGWVAAHAHTQWEYEGGRLLGVGDDVDHGGGGWGGLVGVLP